MSSQTFAHNRFFSDREIEDVGPELFEDAWKCFSHEIDLRWVSSIEIPISTEIAMLKLSTIVNLATYCHDGICEPGKPLEFFIIEDEPACSVIDSWATCSVPLRNFAPIDDPILRGEMGSDGTRTPSVTSFMSSATGRSKSSANSGSRYPSRNGHRTSGDAPKLTELEDDYTHEREEKGHSAYTGNFEQMIRQKNKHRKHEDQEEGGKDDFTLMQEEVERAAVTLKGKKYAFDSTGKPVMINATKAENLPPYAYEPILNISEEDVTERGGVSKSQKKKKKIRVAGSRSVDKAQFTPTTSLATTMAKPNDIMLNPGVSLQSEGMVRQGPPPVDDPNKPSRKQFFTKKMMNNSASVFSDYSQSGYGTLAGGSSTVAGGSSVYEAPGSKDQVFASPSSFHGNGGGSRFVDVDFTEGGRPRVAKEEADDGNATTGATTIEPRGKQDPASVPPKRGDKEKKIMDSFTGGSEKSRPRERLPETLLATRSERRNVAVSTKLAAEGSITGALDNQSSGLLRNSESIYSYNSGKTDASKNKGLVKKERSDILKELF